MLILSKMTKEPTSLFPKQKRIMHAETEFYLHME
jgi:hypothetical protein